MKTHRPGLDLLALAALLLFLVVVPSGHSRGREPVKPQSSNPGARRFIDMAWQSLDHEMTPANLDKAISNLKKALVLDPDNHEVMVELADEQFFRGRIALVYEGEGRKAMAHFQEGLETARKALEIKESAGGHYWFAANLGSLQIYENTLAQASAFPEIKSHVDWVTENHPEYKYGAAARFWMGVVVKSPPVMIKIMGKDPEDIYADLQKAIDDEPRYLENYIIRAEYYHWSGNIEKALSELDRIIRSGPDIMPSERAHNELSVRNAKRLYKEWSGKEHPKKATGSR